MTALTKDRARKEKPVKHDLRPLAAGVKAIKGGSCMLITSGTSQGYYAPASSSKVGIVVGLFDETVDNSSGADGDVTANVDFLEEFIVEKFVNDSGTPVLATNRGYQCYALDDQTVTGAASGVVAGEVYDVVSDGVWVVVAEADAGQASGPSIQTGTTTLVAGTKSVTGVTLTANSRIFVTMKDPGAGAITGLGAFRTPNASRNVGAGSFVIDAIDDSKAVITTAVCTVDWMIVG